MDHNLSTMLYMLEIDVLERQPQQSDESACALLRSELALALNASHLRALGEVGVRGVARWRPQEGVSRYAVALEVVEHDPTRDDARVARSLARELALARNASYLRCLGEQPRVTLAAREPLAAPLALPAR